MKGIQKVGLQMFHYMQLTTQKHPIFSKGHSVFRRKTISQFHLKRKTTRHFNFKPDKVHFGAHKRTHTSMQASSNELFLPVPNDRVATLGSATQRNNLS